jgi:DNA-binding XRE family transcriptional regulator
MATAQPDPYRPAEQRDARLRLAYLDPAGRLVCGFEGARLIDASWSDLGVPSAPRIVSVTVDEFGSGVLIAREDGSIEDIGADLVLYRKDPAFRARLPAPSKNLAPRIARRLRRIRAKRRLSQRALAAQLGIHASNYARLESGRHTPSTSTLVKLCEILRVPLTDLVAE